MLFQNLSKSSKKNLKFFDLFYRFNSLISLFFKKFLRIYIYNMKEDISKNIYIILEKYKQIRSIALKKGVN